MLRIEVAGELRVTSNDAEVELPSSRKTRALLAYLALNPRPQRRDWLSELLWELPDDPRGALRWSLSRLRSALKHEASMPIDADRERVWLIADRFTTDLSHFGHLADLGSSAAEQDIIRALTELRQPILAGLDLPQQQTFQAWLTAERDAANVLRSRLLSNLAIVLHDRPSQALPWLREWADLEPCEPQAAAALAFALRRLGRTAEAEASTRRYRSEAIRAGIQPSDLAAVNQAPSSSASTRDMESRFADRQRVQFCRTGDGVRIAFASVGRGPPLLKAANWLNHLELDWDAPTWAPLFRELSREHCFTRYDGRGNGLSDWKVPDLSFDAMVGDLEAVVEASALERFPLLGISQGCAVAIEFAARHPEKVSHLVLWGGYAAGWRIGASPDLVAEREAIITLVRQGWGREDPTYRRIFSSTFIPSATNDEMDWFDDFQRRTTSAENAAHFLEVFSSLDVRHRLKDIQAPTLVMHAKGDRRIPVASSGEIAAGIAGAEFVAVESDNHILLGREPASADFIQHVRQFLAH